MNFRFEYIREQKWPPLAWIAECVGSNPVIRVRHGPQVETRDVWFCEAVWDDEFSLGNFDRTDLVFGSGARLRDRQIKFVSSGSTVDRLQFLELDGETWVSNSLACLFAVSGVKIDVSYDRFPEFFRSIVRGLEAYERRLPTQSGRLELTYFRNLVWDGRQLVEEEKPFLRRDFSTFDKYHKFLSTSLKTITDNMRSTARNHRYEMVAGLSSGYDSATATVLAREVGLKRLFSFQTARGGQEDHGEKVGRILGLDLKTVERRGWQRQAYSEVPYFAATGLGADVIFTSAKDILCGSVLVSGFHGDKVWAKETEALGPDIVRGDASGLSFTEGRLHLGCLHIPVPFLGVRQIRDIHTLSISPEQAPWDVPGDYSRPLCRRIVEEAGIPRELFGVSKKAATNLFRQGEAVLTEKTRSAYHAWLAENKHQWKSNRAEPPRVPGRMLLALWKRYYIVNRIFSKLLCFAPSSANAWVDQRTTRLQRWIVRRINLVPYLFPWAVDRLANTYASTMDPKN